MAVSPEDRERISAAVRLAEAETSGEIVCVLARRSIDATAPTLLAAALPTLALPWLLMFFTALPMAEILALQCALFAVLALLLSLPFLRRRVAHRAALEQFALHGLGHAGGRAGVLVFVSLAERYARILPDAAVTARVPQDEWQKAVDALVGHLRDGRIADGYVEAIERCGRVLAAHFPREQATADLPPRIHLI